MSTNATIVFVPGAWHTSAGFSAVMDLLATYNYPSIGLHLPSVGGTPVVKDMEPDKALIRSTVTKLVEDGKDVVVVSHSYGGAPANSSLKGLSKTEREKAGKKGGVVASAMISAFLLDVRESLLNGVKPAPWTTTEGETLLAPNPEHVFYNDLTPSEAEHWTSQLLPHSRASFDAPVTYAGWKVIPVHFLLCERDNAIPLEKQRQMCENARNKGANVVTESVFAGHSPFLSKPEVVAGWIRRVAGEKAVNGSI